MKLGQSQQAIVQILKMGGALVYIQFSSANDPHRSLILPTRSSVPLQVYEPVIAIQYPVLRKERLGRWNIGTGTRRTNYQASDTY